MRLGPVKNSTAHTAAQLHGERAATVAPTLSACTTIRAIQFLPSHPSLPAMLVDDLHLSLSHTTYQRNVRNKQ